MQLKASLNTLAPWWVNSDTLAYVDSLCADPVLKRVKGGAVVAGLSSERLDGREVNLEEWFLKLAVVLVHEGLATLDLGTHKGQDNCCLRTAAAETRTCGS